MLVACQGFSQLHPAVLNGRAEQGFDVGFREEVARLSGVPITTSSNYGGLGTYKGRKMRRRT
jgi:hypothetical protein